MSVGVLRRMTRIIQNVYQYCVGHCPSSDVYLICTTFRELALLQFSGHAFTTQETTLNYYIVSVVGEKLGILTA